MEEEAAERHRSSKEVVEVARRLPSVEVVELPWVLCQVVEEGGLKKEIKNMIIV